MLVYWLLFGYFAVGATVSRPRARVGEIRLLLALGALLIAGLIGLRYEVGADWHAYELMFTYSGYAELSRTLEAGDPGYQFLNWSVQQIGGEFWLVNLIAGLIFSWGLLRFAAVQPDPWLAVLVAVPYLVVVVAMGYSRQALAIGILMAGIASVARGGSILRFGVYVAFAALFHRTAVVVFPLVALAGARSGFLNMLVVLAGGIFLYDLFLQDSMDQFVQNYIVVRYSSEGAAIRVVMNLVPAVLFFLFRRRLEFPPQQHLIWRNFSLAAFGLLILLLILPSSTAVDRVSLYIMPLQLAVLARVPGSLMSIGAGRAAIIAYSFAVLFVWLNFATHAEYWVPYKLYQVE